VAAAVGAGLLAGCGTAHHGAATALGACADTMPTAASGPSAAPGAPRLRPVWQRTMPGLAADGPSAPVPVGDALVRLSGRRLMFFDAGTGAVRAVRTIDGGHVRVAAAADDRGRPVAALRTAARGQVLRVYATDGTPLWRSPREDAATDADDDGDDDNGDGGRSADTLTYAGGYVADFTAAHHGGLGDLVIRDRTGRALTRTRFRTDRWDYRDVVAVRPGWLGVAAAGPNGRALWLLDLTSPGHPRWVRLAAPPKRPGDGAPEPAGLTVGDGHLYATWTYRASTSAFARYDVTHAAPAWHTRCLPDTARPQVVTDPRGGAHVLVFRQDTGITGTGTRFRVLDPGTGRRLGPPRGWTTPGDAVPNLALRDGVLYASTSGTRTEAVDVRTGATTRTFDQTLIGATGDGDLVFVTADARTPTLATDRVS
jgi:hypothetical protein